MRQEIMVPAEIPPEGKGQPLILFGAFDRHNFGDLLLGQVAKALVSPRQVVFAGLAERDLSAYGGERVVSIATLAHTWGDHPVALLHVGGELLTCSLYEAAIMLQSDEEARAAIARLESDPVAAHRWAVEQLQLDQAIAYQVAPDLFSRPAFIAYLGVGGVALGHLPDQARRQVLARLRASDHVWVRDAETCRQLERFGVSAIPAPDPAELAACLFNDSAASHGKSGEPAAVREWFPQGYLAVQFSADFGDDATLDEIGASLLRIQRELEIGIVLFRAGGAPWHDRLDVYQRLRERVPHLKTVVFHSLHLLDIHALLSQGCGFAGSSLHGRIVAEAHGHPAASLVRENSPGTNPSKTLAYVESWNPVAADTVATAAHLALVFRQAWSRRNEVTLQANRRQALVRQAVAGCLA